MLVREAVFIRDGNPFIRIWRLSLLSQIRRNAPRLTQKPIHTSFGSFRQHWERKTGNKQLYSFAGSPGVRAFCGRIWSYVGSSYAGTQWRWSAKHRLLSSAWIRFAAIFSRTL